MVGGFGKEILNGVWAAVTLEHDTSLRTCVGYWVNPLIPYWSFPSRIWVCNFSVESMLPMCRVVCSREVQPKSQSYLRHLPVVFCESCTLIN
jgi:hypothetical protein